MLEESHIELVFTRDYIAVRTPVTVPLKGKVWHEEKIAYSDIPVGGFDMKVISIDKQEESDRLVALTFKVSSFVPVERKIAAKPQVGQKVIVKLTNSCFKYHLIYISKCRDLFPGYKVPFILETDVGDLETHVTSAPRNTPYGDPTKGVYIQHNLQRWYNAHPELNVGSQILIEGIEPEKRYRLSILEHPPQLQYRTVGKPHVIDKQKLKTLTEKFISWAQGKNLKGITKSDVKLFLLNSNVKLSGSLEQMLYREAKLKYRYLPPWMRK